ncbi:MAG: TonB-dependent receptor [Deltaproteobacteria bacterium]|nr:TonB-dependent receptor [Deltaproteobacteria bacterium]
MRWIRSTRNGHELFHVAPKCLLVLAVMILFSVKGYATNGTFYFDIPSQKVQSALDTFVEQTNISLVSSLEGLSHLKTNTISGDYTPDQALDMLLKDTGLVFEQAGEGTMAIRKDPHRAQEGLEHEANAKPNNDHKQVFVENGEPDRVIDQSEQAQAGEQAVERKRNQTEDYVLEDTIVTATKTGETRLQSTPIAISTFDGEALRASALDRFEDITMYVPSFSMYSEWQLKTPYIRGIGNTNALAGASPTVQVYIDDVPMARSSGFLVGLFDMERIEILRGPQGTLYGRNVTGGALRLFSKSPTDELSGKASIEAGDYKMFGFRGSLSGPLVKNKVKGHVAIAHSQHGPYVDNVAPGFEDWDFQDQHYSAARGALELTPTDKIDITFRADYYTEDDNPTPPFKYIVNDPATIAAGVLDLAGDVSKAEGNWDNVLDLDQYGVSAHVTVKLPHEMELKSITGWRKTEYDKRSEADGWGDIPSLGNLHTEESYLQEQFSQEFNLSGQWSRLKWFTGLFLYKDRDNHNLWYDYSISVAAWGIPYEFYAKAKVDIKDTYGLFGHGTYALTDRLSVSAGLRYSKEKKSIDYWQDDLYGWSLDSLQAEESWDSVTPKFGIDYRLNDDIFLYGSVANGFTSGGFNSAGVQPAFDQEDIWAYEVGAKTDWFANRLRFNTTVFHYDYDDLQVQIWNGIIARIDNAAKAEVNGVEVEVMARPVDGLTLNAALTYLDSEYKEYTAIDQFTGNTYVQDGKRMTNAPEWAYSVGANYVFPLSDYGFVTLNCQYNWKDEKKLSATDRPPSDIIPDYGLIDAFIAFETTDGTWRFDIFGKNLADEEYPIFKYTPVDQGTYWSYKGMYGTPQTLGARLTYRFGG